VQQSAQLLTPRRIEGRMRGLLGGRGAPCESRPPSGSERVDGIADGLIVAPQGLANDTGRLTAGTGQEDLAATSYKGLGRAQPLVEGLLFALGQRTDINGFSPAPYCIIFPNILCEIALGGTAMVILGLIESLKVDLIGTG